MSLTQPSLNPALMIAASAFVLVAGMGAATTVLNKTPHSPKQQNAVSNAHPSTGQDRALVARLESYAQSIDAKNYSTKPTNGNLLPDVNTMVERLEARLKTTPEDGEGWRMLGWSYFNMAQYKRAVTAYAKAVELNPNSSDLARAFKIAKAKASEAEDLKPAPALGRALETNTPYDGKAALDDSNPAATTTRQYDPAIRSMVDGLAQRLKRTPRDITGWTRLMRSRVVLGEKDVAIKTYYSALEVFKDDSTASAKIMTAAIELGLAAD